MHNQYSCMNGQVTTYLLQCLGCLGFHVLNSAIRSDFALQHTPLSLPFYV
jgi:hypothetical protein